MLSATTVLSRKYYYLLGKILAQKQPEVATQLISDYLPKEQAPQSDFTKIPQFYSHLIESGFPETCTSEVSFRRLFIATMVRLYIPQSIQVSEVKFKMPDGFIKQFCLLFNLHSGNATNLVRQIIVWEKSYDDFRQQVDEVMVKIQNQTKD